MSKARHGFLFWFLGGWSVLLAQDSLRIPISFEQNRGQADLRYSYVGHADGYTLLLAGSEAALAFDAGESLRIGFEGANPRARIEPLDPIPGRSNYLLGSDPGGWVRNLSLYARVRVRGVYPGIDVVYYSQGRECENDFIVAPGADLSRIRVSFSGASEISLDAVGDLVVNMGSGSMRWHKPSIYQEANGVRTPVAGRFRLLDNQQVAFQVDAYDSSRSLVLDPTFSYSTYVGTKDNESAFRVAVDSDGNAYFVGCVASKNYVVTPGSFHTTTPSNHSDVLIAKISPTKGLIFETHIGGSKESLGLGVAVDSTGLYVAGGTSSADFPVKGGFQSKLNGKADAFVLKLNTAGDTLIYSTYLGGSNMDGAAAIAIDSAGNAYVTGSTLSADFPLKSPYQTSERGSTLPNYNGSALLLGDVFISKIDPTGSSLIYSTYFGGSGDDAGFAIAVDAAGAAYVTGMTTSANLPTTRGAFQTTFGGSGGEFNFLAGDAFVLKLDATGQPAYSTYLGGSSDDSGFAITVDAMGNAYIAGTTFSNNFPTKQPLQAAYAGTGMDGFFKWSAGDAFVTELNPTGTALVYSTYLGGSQDDRALGIALDGAGNLWVAGHTLSTNFPVTKDAFQSVNHGYKGPTVIVLPGGYPQNPFGFGDAFVAEIDTSGKLLYSTYLGGSDDDVAIGIGLDERGNVYVVGNTMSTDFPTTSNAAQKAFGGFNTQSRTVLYGDAFVSVFQGAAVAQPAPPPPTPVTITGVKNGASYASGAIAAGEVIVISGSNLGPTAAATAQADATTGKLPFQLAGTTITFDGAPAPLLSVSAGQCTVVVPYSVDGKSSTQIVATFQGTNSAALGAPVAPSAPGLYSADSSGAGPGQILNEDGSANSPSNPATAGSLVTLFGTGAGQTDPPGVDGLVTTDGTPAPNLPISVTIEGMTADVQSVGAAVSQVAGVFQVSVTIPDGLDSGDLAVVVTVETASSQSNLTVSVQ
jgi:uncharacterized protein (TIGR03437 family)